MMYVFLIFMAIWLVASLFANIIIVYLFWTDRIDNKAKRYKTTKTKLEE